MTEKKEHKIDYISSDHEIIVGFSFAASPKMTGQATDPIVEIAEDEGKKDVPVPLSFIGGAMDLVRSKLHAYLDEFLDSCEDKEGLKNEEFKRKEIKRVHPDDGKPQVWMPRGK